MGPIVQPKKKETIKICLNKFTFGIFWTTLDDKQKQFKKNFNNISMPSKSLSPIYNTTNKHRKYRYCYQKTN